MVISQKPPTPGNAAQPDREASTVSPHDGDTGPSLSFSVVLTRATEGSFCTDLTKDRLQKKSYTMLVTHRIKTELKLSKLA